MTKISTSHRFFYLGENNLQIVNKLYRKWFKNNLSTQREFIWTARYEINAQRSTGQPRKHY